MNTIRLRLEHANRGFNAEIQLPLTNSFIDKELQYIVASYVNKAWADLVKENGDEGYQKHQRTAAMFELANKYPNAAHDIMNIIQQGM